MSDATFLRRSQFILPDQALHYYSDEKKISNCLKSVTVKYVLFRPNMVVI